MKINSIGALLVAGILCTTASAECVYPKAPSTTPDGMTATKEEMVAGMQTIKEYNEQVTAYLDCLEKETNARIEAAGPDAPADKIAQIKAIHSKRHNAAVEALEANAARFNEQVKAFKARDE
jgi:hypothetical protein